MLLSVVHRGKHARPQRMKSSAEKRNRNDALEHVEPIVDEQENNDIQVEENGKEDTSNENTEVEMDVQLAVNDWIAIKYDANWHIRKIQDIDSDDGLKISVLLPTKTTNDDKTMFRWSTPSDVIYVNHSDVICKISEPQPIGRSGRSFRLQDNDIVLIPVDTFQKVII